MEAVLAPVFQIIPVPGVAVKTTESPLQSPKGPPAVITGTVTGLIVTVMLTGKVFAQVALLPLTLTVAVVTTVTVGEV